MFGFFFSALKKVYHLFRKVFGNRQQSLPSTKQDLKDPRKYHLGQQSLPSTKQDLKDPEKYHLLQQSLPSTKQDLKDPEKYHLGQQSLPSTKQDLKDPEKYHLLQQSLPSTKQDLKDPEKYHLGQQPLPSTKQDLKDPQKYHLCQQSLPSTKQDLKDPEKYHHNAFSFSRINSPDSIPSAQNAPTTQRQTSPSPVYDQQKDTLPRVTLKVDSGINTRKTPYAPIETHSALPGSAKTPAVLNKPVLCHTAPGSTSHLTKSTYYIVEEGSTPLYEIPEDIKTLIKRDIVPPVLKKPLSPQTYKDYFAALLYAEDYYLEKWDGFETKDVTLRLHEAEIFETKGKYKHSCNVKKDDKVFVEFEMNAIPEKLPFLLFRDFASVRPSGRKLDPFQGIIFRVVKSNIVLVEFGDDFHAQHYSSCKYDVKFSFNRVCLKRAHQSIASASDMLFKKFLFPNCSPKYISHYSTTITRIINITDSHPYLLEGSLSITRNNQLSGTGTLVRDTVVQLCQASSLNRVLICAPLNSTCDVFMRSLQREFSDSEIFRANAAFREVDGVPDDILPFCPYKQKEEVFTCPSLPQLLKFKVILSTFMSSYRLHSNGIEGGHFTHIILVDASSATEPEIMVPLTNLTSVSTKVLVTGSPGNQSRWVRSDIARHNGLSTSYFERLRKSNFYRDLNPEFITQLEDDSGFPATSYFR